MKPYYDEDGITIYHGDCRDMLSDLAADVVLTDPPYGIGDKWASASPVTGLNGVSRLWGHGEVWDTSPPPQGLIDQIATMAPEAIVWGGHYFSMPPARGWLVWDKNQVFSGAEAELAWTNLPIPIRVFRLSRIDAFTNQRQGRKSHPTEKPIQLMRWSLGFTTGARVLDPFMGSGTTLVAARELGRSAVGIEVEERYCQLAVDRLAQGVLEFQ